MSFDGKIVLVAGGTGGLGRAVSLAFLRAGASVAVTFRNQTEYDALRAEATGESSRLTGHSVDVTDEAAVQKLLQLIVSGQGRLDVLVNAVGGYTGGVPAWEAETRDLDRMLALNLRSGWMLARAAARLMRSQHGGAIINVASKAALDHGAASAAYAASKAAALAMMDSLAADLRGTGVRVNSILPSIFDTEANRKAMPGADFSAWPKPEDIARVVLFLAGDDARVIHGAAIPVYGGI